MNYLIVNNAGRRGKPFDRRWAKRGYRSFSVEWQFRHPADTELVCGHLLNAHIGTPKPRNVQGSGRRGIHYTELVHFKTFVFTPICGQDHYTDFARPRLCDVLTLSAAFTPEDQTAWRANVQGERWTNRLARSAETQESVPLTPLIVNVADYLMLAREAFVGFVQPLIDWLRENVPYFEERMSAPPLP